MIQDDDGPALPGGAKNYITPEGLKGLQDELQVLSAERSRVVETVAWAAGNGDRSENGDYIYGKERLREIDHRIRFISKRIESACLVDPRLQTQRDQVFFGATVVYARQDDTERTVTIVGVDEIDPDRDRISWISPVARALLKRRVGDEVEVATPAGRERLEIVSISYPD